MALDWTLDLLHPAFDGGQVGQQQLRVHRADVGQRVQRLRNVGHVGVLEAAHHHRDGVDVADVAQELVAQPGPLARAGHQPGDVHELDGGRHDLVGLDQRRQIASRRWSGTATTPTLGSMVVKG